MSVSTCRRHLCVLLLVLAGSVARVEAQDVTEVTLKGAFLFNFARFTEWPTEALNTDSRVSVCVVGDRAVGEAFSRTVKGKQLAGRAITVTIVAPETALTTCHLLYISGVEDRRLAEIVATVKDAPVLTVSDSEAFTKRGGIVQMFVESGKMRFRVNPRSAKRARLQLSSRLLALAEVVDEGPESGAVVPLTHLLAFGLPAVLTDRVERLSIDWARRFTAWGRN